MIQYCRMSICILLLLGCSRLPVSIPQGFARLKGNSSGELRAVSPDGVVFRVRTIKTPQRVGPEFWHAAIKSHLGRSGYRLLRSESLQTESGLRGGWIESASPLRNRDVKYLVGFFMRRRDILVVEVGGDVLSYDVRISEILETVKKF